jgi:hypothetical protein
MPIDSQTQLSALRTPQVRAALLLVDRLHGLGNRIHGALSFSRWTGHLR